MMKLVLKKDDIFCPTALSFQYAEIQDQESAKYLHIIVSKYLYNFWDTDFKDNTWTGEDVKFCDLAREAGFKFHAIVDGETTHYGTMGYKGKLVDTFQKSNGKSN